MNIAETEDMEDIDDSSSEEEETDEDDNANPQHMAPHARMTPTKQDINYNMAQPAANQSSVETEI